VPDAAYSKMIEAIESGGAPNLLLLHYAADAWVVLGLLLVPHFFLHAGAIRKRNALSKGARRAGWVGCDILLGELPEEGRIPMVVDGVPAAPSLVRRRFRRLRGLEDLAPDQRGWSLDVLTAVRGLGKTEFPLSDVYAAAEELGRRHPRNRHVREKIRQQLQVLRDLGVLEFLDRGRYRLRN
jgi:type II restriction enzyme